MNRITPGICGVVLGLMAASCGAPGREEKVQEPVADFVAKHHREAGDRVHRLVCDIDNDGHADVFLAFSSGFETDGDAGWVLYLWRRGGYVVASGTDGRGVADPALSPTFNARRYVLGRIPDFGRWGLLTSEVATGRRGGVRLRALVVEGDTFRMINVGEPRREPAAGSLWEG